MQRLIFDDSVAALTYGYVFDIANQTMALEEDAINKPYRPACLVWKERGCDGHSVGVSFP
jgi:hypothetical protein